MLLFRLIELYKRLDIWEASLRRQTKNPEKGFFFAAEELIKSQIKTQKQEKSEKPSTKKIREIIKQEHSPERTKISDYRDLLFLFSLMGFLS